MPHMLLSLAKWERDSIRGRTQAGVDRAAAEGRTGGRPPALDSEKVQAVRGFLGGGRSVSAAARAFGVSRPTVRAVKDGTSRTNTTRPAHRQLVRNFVHQARLEPGLFMCFRGSLALSLVSTGSVTRHHHPLTLFLNQGAGATPRATAFQVFHNGVERSVTTRVQVPPPEQLHFRSSTMEEERSVTRRVQVPPPKQLHFRSSTMEEERSVTRRAPPPEQLHFRSSTMEWRGR